MKILDVDGNVDCYWEDVTRWRGTEDKEGSFAL